MMTTTWKREENQQAIFQGIKVSSMSWNNETQVSDFHSHCRIFFIQSDLRKEKKRVKRFGRSSQCRFRSFSNCLTIIRRAFRVTMAWLTNKSDTIFWFNDSTTKNEGSYAYAREDDGDVGKQWTNKITEESHSLGNWKWLHSRDAVKLAVLCEAPPSISLPLPFSQFQINFVDGLINWIPLFLQRCRILSIVVERDDL